MPTIKHAPLFLSILLLSACTAKEAAPASDQPSVLSTTAEILPGGWEERGDRLVHVAEPSFSFAFPQSELFPNAYPPSGTSESPTRCTTDDYCVLVAWQPNEQGLPLNQLPWYYGKEMKPINGMETVEEIVRSDEGHFRVETAFALNERWVVSVFVTGPETGTTPAPRLLAMSDDVVSTVMAEAER
jgi:hypothetical protein